MKKIIYLLSAMLTVSAMHAQDVETYEPKNGWGIKGGVNVIDVHTQNNTPLVFEHNSEYTIGYNVGVFAEVFLDDDKKMAIQPELFYSQDGYKIMDFTYGNVTGDLKYTLRTINLPVLFKYYFTNHFNVFVGPKAIYQIGDKYVFQDKIYDATQLANVNRDLTSLNLAVVSGIEFTGKSGVSLNARYIHGAKSIYKSTNHVDITQRGFQIGLGFKF